MLRLIERNSRFDDADRADRRRGDDDAAISASASISRSPQLMHGLPRRFRTRPTSSTSATARGSARAISGSSWRRCRAARRAAPRCLVSMVDRTVEVQAERTLRAEMLRDSLTGLPNRLSLHRDDRERRGGKVARDSSMRCWWSTCCASAGSTRSMGSLAGDELLITFARRLISALRGGDVLARTGGNEFGILVGAAARGRGCAGRGRAHPGGDDRRRSSCRELEIRVECAIGVALMHAEPGRRGAVPQRPVRGQAGQGGGQAAGL